MLYFYQQYVKQTNIYFNINFQIYGPLNRKFTFKHFFRTKQFFFLYCLRKTFDTYFLISTQYEKSKLQLNKLNFLEIFYK